MLKLCFRSYCFTNSVNYKIFGGIWFVRKVTKLATQLFCVIVVANLNQIIMDMIYSTLNKMPLKKHSQPRSWQWCFNGWEFGEFQAWEAAASQVTLRKLLQGGRWGDG